MAAASLARCNSHGLSKSWLAAVVAIGGYALLKLILKKLRQRGPGTPVPWCKGWVPVLGNMPRLIQLGKDNNRLALGRLCMEVQENEGLSIFRLSIFGSELIMVNDVSLIEEVMTNDPHRFTKQLSSFPGMSLAMETMGNGLFFADTDSEDWIVPHHILKAPFSVKGVKELFPLMSEQADLLVSCIKREVGHGGIAHIDHWVTKMAFETIAVCATGTSFGSFDSAEDAPFIKALNKVMDGFGHLGKVPAQVWFLYQQQLAEIRASAKVLRESCVDCIAKRRSKETHAVTSKRDIMDMMLEDTDGKTSKQLSERQIVDNVLTFLFAGQDSTAAAMATLMCYLNAYPRCKHKLVKEIDDIVGGGELRWEHLSQLQYLDWCIKEAMRLVPPAGGVLRTSNGPQVLGGKWKIPDGSHVIVGIMAAHYNKTLWGDDVKVFRPERWEQGPPHKYAFLPFAMGPRACTGREFTVIEQKITFVKLLQHFDFRRPANVSAETGYTTLKKEDQTAVPFIDMDVEFKTMSAFVGLFSAFEMFERNRS